MKKENTNNVFIAMQRLAAITKNFIAEGKMEKAKKCISLASKIFENGSTEAKTAVSSVYLFSISIYMEVKHLSRTNLLTPTLLKEYQKQINTSGI